MMECIAKHFTLGKEFKKNLIQFMFLAMRKSDSIDGYVLSGDKAFGFLRSTYLLEKPAVLNQDTADSCAHVSKDTAAGEKRKRESKLFL